MNNKKLDDLRDKRIQDLNEKIFHVCVPCFTDNSNCIRLVDADQGNIDQYAKCKICERTGRWMVLAEDLPGIEHIELKYELKEPPIETIEADGPEPEIINSINTFPLIIFSAIIAICIYMILKSL